jgi:hypothetical protein
MDIQCYVYYIYNYLFIYSNTKLLLGM